MAALLGGAMLVANGCRSEDPAPPPPSGPVRLPTPPQIRDVTLGRPSTLRVGDYVSIVLDAVNGEIPIAWTITGVPTTWERTTGTDGRFYNLSGKLPLGSSSQGIDVRAQVVDTNGRRSEPLPIHLEIVPRVYEFQPTALSESDDERVREYELRLRTLPEAEPSFDGRVEIWVDTTGLSAAGGDSLRLWDGTEGGFEMVQAIGGDGTTASSAAEPGETFVLRTPEQLAALQSGSLRLTVRAADPAARIFMVRVTAF